MEPTAKEPALNAITQTPLPTDESGGEAQAERTDNELTQLRQNAKKMDAWWYTRRDPYCA